MSGGYNLGTASGRIEIDGSAADKGFAVARAAADTFMRSVENQREQMEAYGKQMTRQAIVGAGGFAIATKSAAEFEKELSGIKSVSGASAEQMARVSTAALKIGADSAFSATQAAQAFSELAKAGIPLEQALDGAAKATVDLAAAGEISLPRAAEIAANAMNNFGKTGKDMPKIADQIAGAANASAIGVEEFAQSLSQVGAVANLAGISFEDTAVAIAEMGNAGIKGSDAGTSLKTVFMNLIPTTKEQINLFDEMGLRTYNASKAFEFLQGNGLKPLSSSYKDVSAAIGDYLVEQGVAKKGTQKLQDATEKYLIASGAMQNAFFDSKGNTKSLSEIQEILAKSTKNMTKEQKLANLEVLFGSDAIRGAAVMADNGAKGFNDLSVAMGKVGAADTANTRMDNLAGDIEQMRGAMETLSIRLGSVFLPVIRQIVQGFTKVVQFFANATDAGTEMMSKWLVFKTIGMGVTGVLITLVSQFGGLLTVILGIKTAFTFADSAKAAFAALRGGQGIVKALSILMTNTIRGSLLFRGAFKALELVFVRFLGFGGVARVFAQIGPAVAAGLGPLAILKGVMGGLLGVFKTVGLRIFSLITGVNRVAGVFTLLGGPVGLAIRILMGLITFGRLLYGTWEPFRNLVDGIAAAIGGAFNDAMTALGVAWQGVINGFNGVNSAAGGTGDIFYMIGQGAQFLIGWLKQIWDGIVANVVPAFNQFMAVINGSIGPALVDLGNTVSQTLWPALQDLGRVIVEQLFPALKQIFDFLAPIVGVVLLVAAAIVGGLFFAIVKIVEFVLGQMIPSLLQLAGPVLGFLITFLGHLIEVLVAVMTPLVWFATFIFGTLIPGIVRFAGLLINSLVVAFNWVVQAIQNVITWFQNLPGVIEGINSTVNGFFNGIGAAIGGAFQGAVDWVVSVFNSIVAAIQLYIGLWVQAFMMIVEFWRPVWEPLVEIVVAIFDVIMAVVNGFIGLFAALFNYLFQLISFIITTFITLVVTQWTAFWNGLVLTVQTVVAIIVAAWVNFTTMVSVVWGLFAAMISAAWMGFWNGLMAFLQPVIDWFNSTIGAWWNSMFQQSSSGSTSISQVISDIWNGIMGFFGSILATIGSYLAAAWNGYVSLVMGAMNAIWGVIRGIWSGIVGAISGFLSWINSITGGAFGRMVSIVSGFMGQLRNSVSNAWNGVISFLNGIPGTIQGIFAGAWSWLTNVGGQIIDGLLSGLRNAAGGVRDFFQGLTNMIPNWKGPEKRDKVLLKPAGKLIMKSLGDGFESEMDAFYRMLNDMNVNIPLALSATLQPEIPALDKMLKLPVNPTNIVHEDGSQIVSDTYNVDKLIIQNPTPEPASESLPKTIRKLSALGPRSK